MFKPLVYTWRPLMLWMHLVWRQKGFPVQLPTFVARMLAFKLSIDTSKLPAVGDLLRSMARCGAGGLRVALLGTTRTLARHLALAACWLDDAV
jgi:hypothetical protein